MKQNWDFVFVGIALTVLGIVISPLMSPIIFGTHYGTPQYIIGGMSLITGMMVIILGFGIRILKFDYQKEQKEGAEKK